MRTGGATVATWSDEERPHRSAGLRGGRGPPARGAERAVPAPRRAQGIGATGAHHARRRRLATPRRRPSRAMGRDRPILGTGRRQPCRHRRPRRGPHRTCACCARRCRVGRACSFSTATAWCSSPDRRRPRCARSRPARARCPCTSARPDGPSSPTSPTTPSRRSWTGPSLPAPRPTPRSARHVRARSPAPAATATPWWPASTPRTWGSSPPP